MHLFVLKLEAFLLLLMVCMFANAGDLYIDLSLENEVTISTDLIESSNVLKVNDDFSSATTRNVNNVNINLPFHTEVLAAAKVTELDPALIHAVMMVESNNNPKAVSKKGAYGLMQLMPSTARKFNALNQADYQQNIMAGSKYLSELLDLFDGNVKLALAAYNAGPEAVKKYNNAIPPYRETMHYVPRVMGYYLKYSS